MSSRTASCQGTKRSDAPTSAGVRCNGVMPGLVMGETHERQDNQASQEVFVQAARTTRLGRPADPAGISAFLLSDEAEWGAHLRQ
jgi:NAD(P)-dependent dehydrogenase (short-subunit alcohol dehydrogenase family)